MAALTGCTYMVKSAERHHYRVASWELKKTLKLTGVSEDYCQYDFDTDEPDFQWVLTRKEMDGNVGQYLPQKKMIRYWKDQWQVVHHETFHHLARNGKNGPVTYACLEQTSAALLSRIVSLTHKNDHLIAEIRRKERRR